MLYYKAGLHKQRHYELWKFLVNFLTGQEHCNFSLLVLMCPNISLLLTPLSLSHQLQIFDSISYLSNSTHFQFCDLVISSPLIYFIIFLQFYISNRFKKQKTKQNKKFACRFIFVMALVGMETGSSSFPSSSSSSTAQWKYDVFLSFRGEDTRNKFMCHLYEALIQKGIATFKDDQKLEKGKPIRPELLEAIKESKFAIVILSENYASSTWCLDELANIIHC